jgi:hypothetical protein
VFACNLLASRSFHAKPWTIIDYKGDDLITKIVRQNNLKQVYPDDKPPTKPGLYYMKPRPHLDDMAIEGWLMRVWEKENHGLYIDEGYALPQRAAFDMILTQGRSKGIPVIVLYQRPVYMSRFATAQADYFAVFDQNDERDLKTTQAFIKPAITPEGERITVFSELPSYYCLWYDVNNGKTHVLKPAPGPSFILEAFRKRLAARKTGVFV